MKKIDLYILREFLTTFIIVSIFFTLISLIVDVFENLNRFIDNEVSAETSLSIKRFKFSKTSTINEIKVKKIETIIKVVKNSLRIYKSIFFIIL